MAAVGAGPTLDRMTARAPEAAPRGRPVPVPRVTPSTRGATLAAALACAAAVGFGVYAEEGRRALGRSWDLALLDLIAGLVFVGAGAAVFLWRPANRCWWLLVASGATWFLGTLAGVGDDDLAMVGFVTISWHYYFLAHLLLAFPTGRLPARRDVVLLAAIAAVLTVKSLVRLLLYVPPDGTGCQCVQNRFTGVDDGRWYNLAEAAFPWVISVLFALVVAEVVVRWARSSGAGRRMLTPVLIMSAAVAAQIAYSQVIRQELAWAVVRSQDLFVLVVGLRAIAAYSIVVGLRRTGQARAAVAGAVSELDADPARLTAALRSALEDPSLEVLPASSDAVPSPPPGRAVTVIEGDHGPLAALVHDEALLEDPGLISAVTAAIRLTTDNERLRRELQERLDELAASRVRIITAADAERRRIERDLHDGTQQRLISIALQLRLALARAEDAEDPRGRRSPGLDFAVRTAVEELAGAVGRGACPGSRHPSGNPHRRRPPGCTRVLGGPLNARRPDRPGHRRRTVRRCGERGVLLCVRGADEHRQARPRERRRPAGTQPPGSRRDHDRRRRCRRRRRDRAGLGAQRHARPTGRRGWLADGRIPGLGRDAGAGGGPVRVVLADDSVLLRSGIAELLRLDGLDVVGEAGTAEELLEQVRTTVPDVVVVDVRMPPTHTVEGLVAARRIRQEWGSAVGILVLSQYVETRHAVELLAEAPDAIGYLLKDKVLRPEDLGEAVRRVGSGGSALDPLVVSHLLRRRRDDAGLASLTPENATCWPSWPRAARTAPWQPRCS